MSTGYDQQKPYFIIKLFIQSNKEMMKIVTKRIRNFIETATYYCLLTNYIYKTAAIPYNNKVKKKLQQKLGR